MSGIKIELASPSPSLPQSSPQPANTPPPSQHHRHPWLTPLTQRDRWRDSTLANVTSISYPVPPPTAASLYTGANVSALYTVSACLHFSLFGCFSLQKSSSNWSCSLGIRNYFEFKKKKNKTKLVHFNVQQIIYYRALYAFLILNFESRLLGGNRLLLRCQLHFTSLLFAA